MELHDLKLVLATCLGGGIALGLHFGVNDGKKLFCIFGSEFKSGFVWSHLWALLGLIIAEIVALQTGRRPQLELAWCTLGASMILYTILGIKRVRIMIRRGVEKMEYRAKKRQNLELEREALLRYGDFGDDFLRYRNLMTGGEFLATDEEDDALVREWVYLSEEEIEGLENFEAEAPCSPAKILMVMTAVMILVCLL